MRVGHVVVAGEPAEPLVGGGLLPQVGGPQSRSPDLRATWRRMAAHSVSTQPSSASAGTRPRSLIARYSGAALVAGGEVEA